MQFVKKNQNNIWVLYKSQIRTDVDNPVFLFAFKNDVTKEEKVLQPSYTSLTDSYKFQFTESSTDNLSAGTINFKNSGHHTFKVFVETGYTSTPSNFLYEEKAMVQYFSDSSEYYITSATSQNYSTHIESFSCEDLANCPVIIEISGRTSNISNASGITYNNPTYQTVQQALDALLYTAPSITTFTNTLNTVEIGTVVSAFTMNWTLNKPVTTQSINQGIGSITPGITSYNVTGANITNNITYTLTVSDGISAATRTTSIAFQQKRYWGVSPLTGLTNSDILALSNEFATSRATTKTLNATGGNYLYFAYPTAWGVATFTVGGLVTTFQQTIISFVNSKGYTENYYVYRSINLQNGSSITVQIT